MRILVNASTCVAGGGIQVSTAFIRQAWRDPRGHEFLFAVSPHLMRNLESLLTEDDRQVVQISPSPARLFRGRSSRRRLLSLERDFRPDLVFSIASPSYVKFKSKELARFTDPQVSHPSKMSFRVLSLADRCDLVLRCRYKIFWLRKADFFQVQTMTSKNGLVKRVGLPAERIEVVPNTFSDVFSKVPSTAPRNHRDRRLVRLFVLASPYPHKNLTIVPEVASILKKEDREHEYRFAMTLPKTNKETRKFWRRVEAAGVEAMIENAGVLKLEECPAWYVKSDIVFLPTLLETFSATYPEAMQMGKPIVTTDLDFARDICGDAAVFYSPLSARSAADAIRKVAGDEEFAKTLIARGYEQLKKYPSPEEKYRRQLDWIETVVNTDS